MLGLVAVAAATGLVTFALLREPPAPPREVSWQDRERALLTAHEFPDGYEYDYPPGRGVSTELEENAWAKELPAACARLVELVPRARAGNDGVVAGASEPPGPYEDANWESTNYAQFIVSEADADWDGAALRALPHVCPTATAGTGEEAFRVTVRSVPLPEPAGPDSVALHMILEGEDGLRLQQAIAVERVGGELVVLHAGTLADFDLDEFVRLTTAATAKAAAALG